MNGYKITGVKTGIFAMLLLPMATFAELKTMADDELAATQAQAGVNIGINMVMNKVGNDNAANRDCAENTSDCQFGVKLDNMYNPAWLTFTGVSGGVNIRQMNVESSTVATTGGDTPAIKISFDENQKITFTDFGFSSLKVAEDTTTSGVTTEGYRTVLPYGGNASNALDAGRQAGLLGVRVNGDVAVSGAIKIFNCGTC